MTQSPGRSFAPEPKPSGSGGRIPRHPALRRELLANLGVLVAAALSLAVATTLLSQIVAPRWALVALVVLIAAYVAVVFVFGRYLLERLVHRPLKALMEAADALAAGDLARRAPEAETQEFTELAERFNRMTDRLIDAQGHLVRSEKLATVGRFAAGVAHEVGNPLTALGNYLELLRRGGADDTMLAGADQEIERISRIVRGLLDYARPSDDPLSPVDLAAVTRGALALLIHQGTLRNVDVVAHLDAPVPQVLGRAHALEQVVVNLVLNAVDAALAGSVVVGVEAWEYQPRPSPSPRRTDGGLPAAAGAEDRRAGSPLTRRPWRRELNPGAPGALLYVADSGPGVPVADWEKVFDPFFTTKPPGKGTGLGLAVVLSIVEDSGGVVWVENAREGGAAFKVFLPAPAAAGEGPNRRTGEPPGGVETGRAP